MITVLGLSKVGRRPTFSVDIHVFNFHENRYLEVFIRSKVVLIVFSDLDLLVPSKSDLDLEIPFLRYEPKSKILLKNHLFFARKNFEVSPAPRRDKLEKI